MAKYKHLSIPPDEFEPIEQLTRLFNAKNNTDLSAPKIVVMAARRVLADLEADDAAK